MKKILLTLLLLLSLGLAASAQQTETPYLSLTFDNYSEESTKINNYTSKWTQSVDGFQWTIQNFSNYDQQWNYIRFGAKKSSDASASIATSAAVDKPIGKISTNVKKGSNGSITSIVLDISDNSEFTNALSTTITEGFPTVKGTESDVVFTIDSPKANQFYRITFNYTNSTKSNGVADVYNVLYYEASQSGKKPAALKFDKGAYTVYQGDEFTAPELNNPNELPVTWSSTNEEVAMVDENSGEVVLMGASGTTTISAASAETETHDAGTASYTLTVVDAATSIDEMKSLAPIMNNKVYVNFPMTVVYVNHGYTYVIDEKGDATLVYLTLAKDEENKYKKGDIIPAGWEATNATFNGLLEWKGTPAASTETTEVAYPTVKTVSEADINRVVVISGVTFSEATPVYDFDGGKKTKTNFDGTTAESSTLTFRTNWDIPTVPAGKYNVTAAVAYYEKDDTHQLQIYPISYEHCPVITATINGEKIDDIVEVDYGTVVKFTVEHCNNDDILATANDVDITFTDCTCEYTVKEDAVIVIMAGDEIAEYDFIVANPTEVLGLQYDVKSKKQQIDVEYHVFIKNHKEGEDSYKVMLTIDNNAPVDIAAKGSIDEIPAVENAPMRTVGSTGATDGATHKLSGTHSVRFDVTDTKHTVKLAVYHNDSQEPVHETEIINKTTTGIEDVTVDGADAPVEYYTPQGLRVATPEAGQIYIVRRGARVTKELSK